jgi:hypothetical protein
LKFLAPCAIGDRAEPPHFAQVRKEEQYEHPESDQVLNFLKELSVLKEIESEREDGSKLGSELKDQPSHQKGIRR